MVIPKILKEVAKVFDDNGALVFLVGGAVRDMFLKKQSADFDIATNITPQQVSKIFHHVIPTGIKHGTVTVLHKGKSFEVTTFRSEGNYTDGRHPQKIEYASTIEEDLSRRDFCMNAIAVNLKNNTVVDPFDGRSDIKNKVIRCVGEAKERFAEDGLRVMRALRFASTLNFKPDEKVLDAIPAALPTVEKVSAERKRDELEKIIASNNPLIAIKLMEKTGLLKMILPQLCECIGVEQKGYHKFDVYTHSLLALDYAAKKNYCLNVRLAALFHDLGKVKSRKVKDDGVATFYSHEKYSSEITGHIMRGLRFANVQRDEVMHLVREHMFHYEDCWNDGAVRRFIARVGEDNLGELFQLRMADSFAMQGTEPPPALLLPLQKRIDAVLEAAHAFSLKDLCIKGGDIIELGVTDGKKIGLLLNQLLEAVLEDPALNTYSKLKQIALVLISHLKNFNTE